MRWYAGAGTYHMQTIASADDTFDADGAKFLSFSQAQALVRTRFVEAHRVAAGMPAQGGPYTVKACVEEYLVWLDQNRKSGKDARLRAAALILPQVGAVECAKLTTKMLRDWRDTAATTPARLRTKKGEAQRFRAPAEDEPEEAQRRRRASVNRTLTILKAALNQAWRDQKISSDQAWRALTPFEEADAARVRYLTVEESRRLIDAAGSTFRNLVRAALLTGCRFGELAALNAADYHPDSGTLQVRRSKAGRARHVVLTDEGRELFSGLAAGRDGKATLIARADGGRWQKSQQSWPMADACEAGKIDPPSSFHILRHTYASLAVMNGAPLMVVARNLGHVDTRMVEKHYGHMSESYVAHAIRAAIPRFSLGQNDHAHALDK